VSGTEKIWPKKGARVRCASLGVSGIVMGVMLILGHSSAPAQDQPPAAGGLGRLVPTLEGAVNPNPLAADLELPMPCGGTLVFRHMCVPAEGFFGDLQIELGCNACGRPGEGFMEGKRRASISGPFTREDLPEVWGVALTELAEQGDGACPRPSDPDRTGFYYFIGKYEITNLQWKLVMEETCPDSAGISSDDLRPRTGISWFEAVEFTRRYTEWLLKHVPESLPHFSGGRFAYVRLPTEAEWEYAARGGHMVSQQALQEDFFPLNGRPYRDYVVFTELGATKPPQNLAWIGSKHPNPAGLFDTAGNAAEMVLDPFHFSLGFRLHGAAGGFIAKGGSYLKTAPEVMPGRREELPFFLEGGAYRSRDLGFRVVLSAIVTPRDRYESLGLQWSSVKALHQRSVPSSGSQKTTLLDHETARGVAEGTPRETRHADALTAAVKSALFTAESIIAHSLRRWAVLHELRRLELLNSLVLPESSLQVLQQDISKVSSSVADANLTITTLLEFYIERIRETQGYPDPVVSEQMRTIANQLKREEGFNANVKSRFQVFEIFEKHVALYNAKGRTIDPEEVLADLVPSGALEN